MRKVTFDLLGEEHSVISYAQHFVGVNARAGSERVATIKDAADLISNQIE